LAEAARQLTAAGLPASKQALSKLRGLPDPSGTVGGIAPAEEAALPALAAAFGDGIFGLFRPGQSSP
jgi:hypothetical protein